MHHLIVDFLKSANDQAIKYHVEPKIFLGLYALHYLLLWPTVAIILVRFRQGREIVNLISLALFFLVLPWFYPLFFGKLPWFAYVGLIGAMGFIAWHGYHNIQKKLAMEKQKIEAAKDTAVETMG